MATESMASGDPWLFHTNQGENFYPGQIIINDSTMWTWGSFEEPDPDLIVSPEELKIRRENIFVKELYEQYKVALILASGGENL